MNMEITRRRPSVLYVFGAGHSGSSFLDVLLDLHPKVTGMGEVHRLTLEPERRICACGETLSNCPLWQHVVAKYCARNDVEVDQRQLWTETLPVSISRKRTGNKISRGLLDCLAVYGHPVPLAGLTRMSRWAKYNEQVIRNSLELYGAVSEVTGCEVVVDSTKNPLRGKLLSVEVPKNFWGIKLVRDGRAVAASTMRRENVSMSAAAWRWVKANVKLEASLRSIPGERRRLVRYEDVCLDPQGELGRLWEWIGVECKTETIFEQLGGQKKNHQIPGNPALLEGISTITPDQRWKRELNKKDLRTFEWIAGALNRKYGYK